MKNQYPYIIGLANQATLDSGIPSNPLEVLGIYNPVFMFDGKPQIQLCDLAGSFTGLKPVDWTADQWIPMPAGMGAPAIGDPCLVAWVGNSANPQDANIAAWTDVAHELIGLHKLGSEFRAWMDKGSVAALHVARFVGRTVPGYVRHGAEFSMDGDEREIQAFAESATMLATANPEWAPREAKATGPELQGP